MRNVSSDVLVLDSKSSLMQRAQRAAAVGYYWHTSGTVPCTKARGLVRKFRDCYLIAVDKNARYIRRKLNLANAVLLMWQPEHGGPITFVLMLTEGDHPAHSLERLNDARENRQRLTLTGYELVRHTRPGEQRPSWTWRMTAEEYEGWRDRIRDCVRARNLELMHQAWHSLHRVPGFAANRLQVRSLVRLFRAEWKRGGRGAFPLPAMRHRYLSLLPVKGRLLRDVLLDPLRA